MKKTSMILTLGMALALFPCTSLTTSAALFGSSARKAERLDADATSALGSLYTANPTARMLASQAKAILVFPDVLKGGFMFGGQVGTGVLRQNGRTIGVYNITAASYGFQAGIQSFGYALFLMSDSAIEYINKTGGWEIGMGPSIVVVDEGMAKTLTSSTLRNDIYAFVFNQTGLMAGAGLQGSKITRISP